MKRRLALIHTVNWYTRSVIEPYADGWLSENPDVEITNILDDSLLTECLLNGGPTPSVLKRLLLYVLAAEGAGMDVVMVTCTTAGQVSRIARRVVSVPVFTIDEPMAREAVSAGERFGVIATIPTTAPAAIRLLEREAERLRKRVEVQAVFNEEAFGCLMAGETQRHNDLIQREMDKLARHVDAVVLGQIGLGHVEHNCGKPLFQPGRSGFAEARRLLELTATRKSPDASLDWFE